MFCSSLPYTGSSSCYAEWLSDMDPNDDDDSLPPFQYSISASTTPVPPNSTTQATSESTTQHSSNSTILAGNGSTNLATASMTAQTSTTRSQPTFSVVRPSDVTQELQMYVEEHPVFHMEVRRDFILPDTIKATKRRGFKPTRRVKVNLSNPNSHAVLMHAIITNFGVYMCRLSKTSECFVVYMP